jgi:hypothetical protein
MMVCMPKNTAAALHATDLDYDVASLSEPLSDAALDVLDAISDAKDALPELLAYLNQAQAMAEAGRTPFEISERFGFDLDELIDRIAAAIKWTVA